MKYKAFLLATTLIALPGCKENKKCNDSCTQPLTHEQDSLQPGINHTESSHDTPQETHHNPDDMELSIGVRI